MIQLIKQSVQSVIDGGRIGGPVFLRCMVQVPVDGANMTDGIASLTALANTWIPSSTEQIYAQESADATQITAMVKYTGGQTAILSINRIPENQEASVDLILVGNKGVIYHETPVGRYRTMNAPLTFIGGESLVDLIHRAMTTGKPIKIVED
jgi:hypothetical protein